MFEASSNIVMLPVTLPRSARDVGPIRDNSSLFGTMTKSYPIVTKLYLVTGLLKEVLLLVYDKSKNGKRIFPNNCVPKCNLGTIRTI